MGIIEGDLNHTSLTRVLQRVSAFGQNGILTLQGEDDIVAVSFLRGAIVSADALNQTIEDGLGKVLLSQGLIQPEDLAAVVREYQGGSSGSFADLLVQRGLVGHSELLEGLRVQTLRQMLQLLTWRQGEFKFYPGDEVSFEKGFVPIAVEELLVRAIERLGDKVGLPGTVPDVDAVFRRVPPRGSVQVLDRDGDGTTLGIWLTEAQDSFLSRIDGHRSAVEVGKEVGFDRFKSQFTLYNLIFFDLIEPAGRSTRSAASAAAAAGAAAVAPAPASAFASGERLGSQSFPPQLEVRQEARSTSTGSAFAVPTRTETVAQDLKAEIFQPPDLGSVAEVGAGTGTGLYAAPAAVATSGGVLRWIGSVLAALLFAGLALGMLFRPASILLPFPWFETPRVAVERDLRQSLYLDVDRQAKTYFLISAHYPDTLKEVVEWGLLSSGDLRDPAGYQLEYAGADVTYTIRVKDGDEVVEGLGTAEAITGDFLVDPQFFRSGAAAESPLVFLE